MRRLIFFALLTFILFSLTYCNSAGDGHSSLDSVNNAGNRETDTARNWNANTNTATGTYNSGGTGTGADTSRATNNKDSLQ